MSRKVIVVVNGRPRSGKDTVVDGLKDELIKLGWVAEAMSSIDNLDACLNTLGLELKIGKRAVG